MTTPIPRSESLSDDLLGDYVINASRLHEKLARIADNQGLVAASLGRAAIALRSIGALNQGRTYPDPKKSAPNSGNDLASC